MNIDEFVALAERVHNAERMNFGSSSTRESRNADWARIVGIAHWGHPHYNPNPDPQWHLKNGGGGRPQSDDVVVSVPSRKFWDCIPSAGADGYRFQASGHGDEALPAVQEVYPPPKPSGGGVSVPVPPGPSNWQAKHTALLAQLGQPNGDHDRPYVKRVAEQFAFSFPDEGWGMKHSGGQPSDNVLGRKVNGRLKGYKIVPAVSTPVEWDLSSQHFVPVEPKDHVESKPVEPVEPPVEPPVDPPKPPAPVESINDVLTALKALLEGQAQLLAVAQQVRDLAQSGDATLLTQAITRLSNQLDKGFKITGKAGWAGSLDGNVTLKD